MSATGTVRDTKHGSIGEVEAGKGVITRYADGRPTRFTFKTKFDRPPRVQITPIFIDPKSAFKQYWIYHLAPSGDQAVDESGFYLGCCGETVGIHLAGTSRRSRVCNPIFWEIARDSFNDLNKILGLNEAIDKLLDFDYEAESSNGWSIEQKIWGVHVAIDILEDILDSPDVAEAFRLGKESAENWVEHAHLLKPGMNVSPYMSAMQDPRYPCRM
ncbi:uncharacterized protein LW93_4134 [Fusarium fujikuroi]|nr:uncharacterized protein LW93_4134 [Fusarium fujikuroi]